MSAMLAPRMLNVVSRHCKIVKVLEQWWMSFKNRDSVTVSKPGHHIGHLLCIAILMSSLAWFLYFPYSKLRLALCHPLALHMLLPRIMDFQDGT